MTTQVLFPYNSSFPQERFLKSVRSKCWVLRIFYRLLPPDHPPLSLPPPKGININNDVSCHISFFWKEQRFVFVYWYTDIAFELFVALCSGSILEVILELYENHRDLSFECKESTLPIVFSLWSFFFFFYFKGRSFSKNYLVLPHLRCILFKIL